MTLFRNLKDGRLYKMYRVSPMKYTGSWYEIEDFITGQIKKVPQYLRDKLVPAYTYQ